MGSKLDNIYRPGTTVNDKKRPAEALKNKNARPRKEGALSHPSPRPSVACISSVESVVPFSQRLSRSPSVPVGISWFKRESNTSRNSASGHREIATMRQHLILHQCTPRGPKMDGKFMNKPYFCVFGTWILPKTVQQNTRDFVRFVTIQNSRNQKLPKKKRSNKDGSPMVGRISRFQVNSMTKSSLKKCKNLITSRTSVRLWSFTLMAIAPSIRNLFSNFLKCSARMQGSGNAAAIWFVPNTERGVRPDTLTSRRRGERYLRCEELHRLSAPTGIEEPVPPPWPGVRERDGDGKCRRAGGKASTGRGCGTTRGGLATEALDFEFDYEFEYITYQKHNWH
ncbi:unnamed protein product, partial [Nesidiocoris tenuis]